MSDEQISSDAEVDAARRVVRLFDADPATALALFREILLRRGLAGRVLQQLNRLDRHDIVVALGDVVVFGAETQDLVIVESARALARGGELGRAEDLLSRASATRRTDYNFQFSAGRVLAENRMHAQALAYFEAALTVKPTQLAAERVFASRLALERYREAVGAMGRIIRAGTFREGMADDFAFLLQHVRQGELDPDVAYALSEMQGAEAVILPALMPHLIALDLRDCVLASVDRNIAGLGGWHDATLLAVVPYLASQGQFDHLLRIRDQLDAPSAAVKAMFDEALGAIAAARLAQCLSPDLSGFSPSGGDAKAYREIAARFAGTMDSEDGLKMLRLLPRLVGRDDAARFYAREKHRIARLASRVVAKLDGRDDAMEALVELVLHFADPSIAQFFAGSAARELAAAIAEAKRQGAAPGGSRLALLREDYFDFHFERRTGLDPGSLASDVQFSEAAFDYFASLAQHRPAVQVPVARALAERLGRPSLALGAGGDLDVMSCWGLMQARPQFSLAQPGQFDEIWWWYLNGLFARRAIPPQCLNPGIASYLNEVVLKDDIAVALASRFLQTVRSRSLDHRRSVDLGNLLDRILFALDLVVTLLPRCTQFLPFLDRYLADPVLARAVAALGGTTLLDAVAGKAPARPAAHAGGGVQDILLVGHGGRDTGLGRNFGMLAGGLSSDGFALTRLNFDAGADAISDEIDRWYRDCRSRPIVVFAVNAHDVPDIFMKDRGNILVDCYLVGFFLWEVSRIPRLQRLGVAIVDEIWAPTKYVADIYAPHRPTHVVGKGLFAGDEPFLARPKIAGANPRFTFVTVFDFDSSIERKNPLAVVLAFRRAFAAGEKVELVVKTSNVNPQHWSNASGHWERLVAAAGGDKRIKLVTQRYTNDEMTALVGQADCVVSLHRSEGFGYLIADAMAFGVPVIATGYSGNVDFSSAETSFPVAYRLVPVPPGAARWRCDGAEWADPDIDDAAARMRDVFRDYDGALEKAVRARRAIKTGYGIDTFRAALAARVRAIASQVG